MLERIFRKFKNAFNGIKISLKEDRSIKIQFLLALITVFIFVFLKLNITEWAFVLTSIILVIVTEFINSAIEIFSDLLVSNYNIKVKKAKDVAAGAVLIAALYSLIIGLAIIVRRIL